jgi:hypothetical protein
MQQTQSSGVKKQNLYDKNLKNKTEIPTSLFSFLFSEIVQYILSKSDEEKDFDIEEKLSSFGYSIGEKVLELCCLREKGFKRETKIVSMLQLIHNNVWKMLFNKQADGLQKSTDDPDEYRIIENTPLVNKFITLQKGNSLNCASIFAGVIEGILNSADFRCKVSAFFYEIEGQSKTYYIIKFDSDVIARDNEIK